MTTIHAHIAVAPHAPSLTNPNGLHRTVNPQMGLRACLAHYCPPDVAERVDGRFWNHPFGKWSRVPWLNPFGILKMTGMRVDARVNALREKRWLVEAFDATVEDRDQLYVGGVPPMYLSLTTLVQYVGRCDRVWFDGTSANGGTLLHKDMLAYHREGKHVGAEANRKCLSLVAMSRTSRPNWSQTADRVLAFTVPDAFEDADKSVPVIAHADQWIRSIGRDATHWTIDRHPPRSAAWFQHGVKSRQDLLTLEQCVAGGLDLIVNFGATNVEYTKQVFKIGRAG